jgi:hypothetical protein
MSHISHYQILIPWGKYKSKSFGFIKDIDPAYIEWMAVNTNAEPWKSIANDVLC